MDAFIFEAEFNGVSLSDATFMGGECLNEQIAVVSSLVFVS